MEYIILFPIFLLRSWHVSRVFKTLVYWLKKNNQIQDLIISLWKFTYGYLTTDSTKMSQFWMLPTVSFAPLWSVPRSYRWQNTKRRIQQRTQRQGPQKQTLSVRLSALADMWILAIWPGSLSSSRAPLRKSTLSGLSVDTQEVGWLLLAGTRGQKPSGVTALTKPVEPREGNEVTNLAWHAKCRRQKPSRYTPTCWLRKSVQQWIAFAKLFRS